jgi:PhzF family phenazine biosynthesis protein
MSIPLYIVDAFTDKPFSGNPAAVCPLNEWLDDSLLQSIAAENNLSETAFFVLKGDGYHLRWFTPVVEVPLCGHATLASAYVLFNHLGFAREEIVFETVGGELRVRRKDDLLLMNFPARDPQPVEAPEQLIQGLGLAPVEVCQSEETYLVVYENENIIQAVKPDFPVLEQLDNPDIIITAQGKTSDFVSRFFAPKVGVPEDPVTGSAHCTLIPYWAQKLNKNSLRAQQVSKRGGELFCENLGDRVQIGGKAVTYAVGEIKGFE